MVKWSPNLFIERIRSLDLLRIEGAKQRAHGCDSTGAKTAADKPSIVGTGARPVPIHKTNKWAVHQFDLPSQNQVEHRKVRIKDPMSKIIKILSSNMTLSRSHPQKSISIIDCCWALYGRPKDGSLETPRVAWKLMLFRWPLGSSILRCRSQVWNSNNTRSRKSKKFVLVSYLTWLDNTRNKFCD